MVIKINIVVQILLSHIIGRKIHKQSTTDSMLVLVGVVCSLVYKKNRPVTHQEHSEICEVITETAGLIRRKAVSFTASAVPTTLPT